MKLATYKDGSRDGQLVVVSRDLATAHFANSIATRLQQLLDDWNFIAPQLEEIYTGLNHGRLRHAFAFDAKLCMAPLVIWEGNRWMGMLAYVWVQWILFVVVPVAIATIAFTGAAGALDLGTHTEVVWPPVPANTTLQTSHGTPFTVSVPVFVAPFQ